VKHPNNTAAYYGAQDSTQCACSLFGNIFRKVQQRAGFHIFSRGLFGNMGCTGRGETVCIISPAHMFNILIALFIINIYCGHAKLACQCIRRRRASYSKSGIRDAVTIDVRRLCKPQEQRLFVINIMLLQLVEEETRV
jgi:hypothetical protein